MSVKTLFIIAVSVLVTVILMNNTDEINFWIFGDARISKLTILGAMFGLGLIVGFLAGRPRSKPVIVKTEEVYPPKNDSFQEREVDNLSDEDREYIR